MSSFYVIAVDCGSESARACIVEYSSKNENAGSVGKILITRKKDIAILHPKPGGCSASSVLECHSSVRIELIIANVQCTSLL